MDATYSLRSRNDSCDSFAVVSVGGGSDQGEYEFDFESESESSEDEEEQNGASDGDGWEDVGDDDNSAENDKGEYESNNTVMEPHVQLHHQYFKVDAPTNTDESNNNAVPDEPECESDPEPMEECGGSVNEPPTVTIDCRSPTAKSAADAATLISRANTPLSPSSKSRNAKEALRSFYLLKAKQTEETLKLIVVRPPPPSPPPSPPQTVILPLKAPVRYSVPAQEEAIQTENAKKAQAALQQFYLARELAKKTRAALNRSNEAKLIQSQSGRGVLHTSTEQMPTWETMQRVLTR